MGLFSNESLGARVVGGAFGGVCGEGGAPVFDREAELFGLSFLIGGEVAALCGRRVDLSGEFFVGFTGDVGRVGGGSCGRWEQPCVADTMNAARSDIRNRLMRGTRIRVFVIHGISWFGDSVLLVERLRRLAVCGVADGFGEETVFDTGLNDAIGGGAGEFEGSFDKACEVCEFVEVGVTGVVEGGFSDGGEIGAPCVEGADTLALECFFRQHAIDLDSLRQRQFQERYLRLLRLLVLVVHVHSYRIRGYETTYPKKMHAILDTDTVNSVYSSCRFQFFYGLDAHGVILPWAFPCTRIYSLGCEGGGVPCASRRPSSTLTGR